MESISPYRFLKRNKKMFIQFLVLLILSRSPEKSKICSNQHLNTPNIPPYSDPYSIHSLHTLNLNGNLSFHNNQHAAKDFGNRYHYLPLAVLYPESVSDISSTIKHIYKMGPASKLTVTARGHGHSLEGQSQAYRGLVINMESLSTPIIQVHSGSLPYVDVSGGELWINILHECLKHELAPKSWTDYLHLTVGGTLSNAGISGQAFRHGPQIDNVHQLEVVTGKGEVLTCSAQQNPDLFYGVLGGLGQFGVITRARIALEPAPKKVMWIRALYSDFSIFIGDQEHLIANNLFDYIEGFVIINSTGIVTKWRSLFSSTDPLQAKQFDSKGKTLFCLELAKYFTSEDTDHINQKAGQLLSELSYIPHTLFLSEVTYVEFLDRVHTSENQLREKGLWDVPHPWLNLLIPRRKIEEFAKEVFGNILVNTGYGPILIYPVNQSKWNKMTSLVTPEEDIFYIVAFLFSAVPYSTGSDGLEHILAQNERIINFCERARLEMKQYLPHYRIQGEWQDHYGPRWKLFAQRKFSYDPLAILASGHKIFPRVIITHSQIMTPIHYQNKGKNQCLENVYH